MPSLLHIEIESFFEKIDDFLKIFIMGVCDLTASPKNNVFFIPVISKITLIF